MHLRRLIASGLTAFALLGLGAVVAPAAAQAAPAGCYVVSTPGERALVTQITNKKKFVKGLMRQGRTQQARDVQRAIMVLEIRLRDVRNANWVCVSKK